MPNTMDADGPWEYIDLLNECIRILFTVAIGATLCYAQIFDAKVFVPAATRFVFYVALPLHVARGIGLGVDFYNEDFSWVYIASFLILRAMALVLSTIVTWWQGESIGQIAVMWLSLSWISTIILGIPISTAVFGSPRIGAFYGLLAAISSFIFQLPLQLLFLECHALEQEETHAAVEDVETPSETIDRFSPTDIHEEPEEKSSPIVFPPQESSLPVTKEEQDPDRRLVQWLKYLHRSDIWYKILIKMSRNPVVWGIIAGFMLSLTTVGPRFLNPNNKEDYVPGLGWIWTTAEWFGACVSPVSLFTMGVWMQDYFKNSNRRLTFSSLRTATLYMIAKLVLVPLVMLGLASALDFDDNAGRAAVLIAALPISMASFTLSAKYGIGQSTLAMNVALGTALLLPTILLWNLFLDAVNMFPITQVGV